MGRLLQSLVMIIIKSFILSFSLYLFVANVYRFLIGLPFSFNLKDVYPPVEFVKIY